VAHYFARAAGMNDASVIPDKFGIVLHQERAIRIAMAIYQYMEETGLVPISSRACGEYVLNVIHSLPNIPVHPYRPGSRSLNWSHVRELVWEAAKASNLRIVRERFTTRSLISSLQGG